MIHLLFTCFKEIRHSDDFPNGSRSENKCQTINQTSQQKKKSSVDYRQIG